MRRIIGLVIFSIFSIALFGCASEDSTVSSEPHSSVSSELHSSADTSVESSDAVTKAGQAEIIASTETVDYPAAGNHITWELGSYGVPNLEGQKQINRLLMEKGYDCEIQFVSTGAFKIEDRIPWLEKYESENPPFDVLFTGSWNYDVFKAMDFVQERHVPLSDYLNSDDGRALKDFFTPYEWAFTTVSGNVYAIPLTVSPSSSIGLSKYMYVPEDHADLFSDYDGSYEMFREIYDRSGQKDKMIILQSLDILEAFTDYSRYLYSIPFDLQRKRFVDLSEEKELRDLISVMAEDVRNGVLSYPVMDDVSTDRTFAILQSGRSELPGYVEIPLQKTSAYLNLNMSYGISKKSDQKDLAFKILAVCYTDPDIQEYLLPALEGKEKIAKRRELLSQIEVGEVHDFIPQLSDEMKAAFLEYPYTKLFNDILVYAYDEEIKTDRWMINDEYDVDAILEEMEAPQYQELIEELNKQLDAYYQSKGAS